MRILLVGSIDGPMTAAGKLALDRGAKVATADSVEGALNALRDGRGADAVLCDVKLDIAQLVASLKSERIVLPVIACGIAADKDAAVRAVKAGAKDYLPLPPDTKLIAAVFEAIAEESEQVVYADPRMQETYDLAAQVAPSDASVLILGESGTGKEVMARFLHRRSRRREKPFIAVNCAAIPEALLESELFGHEKGAFTGAVARRLGKFEEANGGTLLLDEISEMHPQLQAKLLRAIQEKEIDRLGSSAPVKIDVRILATSNRDMEEAVKAGQFREDLYFRLNVMTIDMPALRERPGDVPPLAAHFVEKYSDANGIEMRPLSDDALEKLKAHHWRGNVRELENTMHRAVLLARGTQIAADAIMLTGKKEQKPAAGAGDGALVGRTVADVERDLIINTLNQCLGNRTHAANILGISIRTLRNKLKLYADDGVSVPPPGGAEA